MYMQHTLIRPALSLLILAHLLNKGLQKLNPNTTHDILPSLSIFSKLYMKIYECWNSFWSTPFNYCLLVSLTRFKQIIITKSWKVLDLLLSISASLRSGEFWTHTCTFFRSPEQKAHVSFSDLNLTGVRHCDVVIVINFVFKFVFFSRTIGSISTKHRTKHPSSWMKGNQVFTNKDHSIFKKEVHVMSFFSSATL